MKFFFILFILANSFSCLTQLKVMLGWVELLLSWGFDNLKILYNKSINQKSVRPEIAGLKNKWTVSGEVKIWIES